MHILFILIVRRNQNLIIRSLRGSQTTRATLCHPAPSVGKGIVKRDAQTQNRRFSLSAS